MRLSSIGRMALAAIAAFIFSAIYYGFAVGGVWRELSGVTDTAATNPLWQILAQLGRNLVVAAVMMAVFHRAKITRLQSAMGLAVILWLGFQAMALAGSVIHEHYSLALYAIHSGDQLATTLIMAFCLAFRRTRGPRGGEAVVGAH